MEKTFDFGRLLQNHEKKHKCKPLQFVSVAGGVQKRLENNLKFRRSSRLTIFDSIRNLSRNASPVPLSEAQQKLENRKQQLEKWKEEKQKKKKEAASQKKKPFISGVPHVPLKYVPPPPVPVRPSTSGGVTTRSQSTRNSKQIQEKKVTSQSFAPKNAKFKPPVLKNVPKVPYVMLVPLKPKSVKPANTIKNLKSPEPPLVMQNIKTPEQITEGSNRISPCVTMSRGKDNARREMIKKLEQGLLDEDTCDTDNVDHFRRQLTSEIERISEMCDTWERISEQTALSDSVQECVLVAVGQARLLMSQKMQQFATLVERCARPEPGSALVTPADLHGFWDMLFMQVENVDMRFKELEGIRARGWVEDQPVIVAKNVKTNKVPKTKPVGAASRIKEMIAAARKAKKDQQPASIEKTFEAGFFCVKSPVRFPTPNTPLSTPRPSLLNAVLSSEAQKSASKITNTSASFAMLRASVLGKNMECDGVAPLPLTPLPEFNATPGRSILKQSCNDTASKSSSKCIKMVLFDQSDTETNHLDNEKEHLQPEDVIEPKKVYVDSGLSEYKEEELVMEKKEKENSIRKSHRLSRQDATEVRSPVITRSRRKSHATVQEKTKTPQEKTKTPREKTKAQENKTPQEKTKSKEKTMFQEKINTQEKTRRSTCKSKALKDVDTNVMEEAPRRRRDITRTEL